MKVLTQTVSNQGYVNLSKDNSGTNLQMVKLLENTT